MPPLGKSDQETIKEHLTLYTQAADATQTPWQALASVHISGVRPFEMNSQQIHDFLMHYTDISEIQINTLAATGLGNTLTLCMCIGGTLLKVCEHHRLDLDHSLSAIKEAFYNFVPDSPETAKKLISLYERIQELPW